MQEMLVSNELGNSAVKRIRYIWMKVVGIWQSYVKAILRCL